MPPPTSNPLKLFVEDIEKSQTLTLYEKYVKIQMYLVSLKEEMSKIKDLGLPNSKRILDHGNIHFSSNSQYIDHHDRLIILYKLYFELF